VKGGSKGRAAQELVEAGALDVLAVVGQHDGVATLLRFAVFLAGECMQCAATLP